MKKSMIILSVLTLDNLYFLPHKDVPNGGVHFHRPTPATLVLERERERGRIKR